jgi:hypothetical protein
VDIWRRMPREASRTNDGAGSGRGAGFDYSLARQRSYLCSASFFCLHFFRGMQLLSRRFVVGDSIRFDLRGSMSCGSLFSAEYPIGMERTGS